VEDKTQKAVDAFIIQRKAMMAAARAVSNANKTESTEAKDPDEETILDMKAYILALVSRRERNVDWKHVDISVVLQEAKVIRETLSQSSVNGEASNPKSSEDKKAEQKNDEVEDKEKREKQEKVEKEREQRRKEREEREFREREKLWEQWEKDREYRREKDREREKKQQNRAALDLQYDDNERKKRTSDYYQKKRIRDRERQEDIFENQREKEEKENQAKRLKEKQDQEDKKSDNRDVLKIVPSPSPFTSSSVLSPSSLSPSPSPGPSPVVTTSATSFNSGVRVVVPITLNPSKKIVLQKDEEHPETDDVFSKKKRKLATLDEGILKRQQLDSLISQIPTESEKLYEYPIDWNAIQKVPFFSKE
jgi:hypothetical protein